MSEHVSTKILIVGSGANAISPAVKLAQRGETDFRMITKDSDFGGVWHVNRYPGCITDIHVAAYQFSYEISGEWKSSHPEAGEMANYLRKVARHHGLYDHVDFNTELLNAQWDDNSLCWIVTTSAATYHAQFLVLSTGFLEQLKFPDLAGQEKFKGRIFHSVHWPEGYTGAGDRIAVLGTSASGVQIVPEMQKVAEHVFVFQRTAMHLLPLNREVYSPEELARRRSDPNFLRKERDEKIADFDKMAYEALFNSETPQQVAERQALIDAHRERLVPDAELREKLTPDYLLGCKRPTRTDLFYPSLQQSNVTLIAEGAVALEENQIIAGSGAAL